MTRQCICEICNCGRHRCPHVPTSVLQKSNGPCQISEYKNVYHPHQITKRDNFKPEHAPVQGGPFDSETTNRNDYKQHQMERPYVHPAEQYVKPVGDMENKTSYKNDYTEKHAPRAKAIRNDGQRLTPAKFEGEPTYKTDYRRWEAAGRPQGYAAQNQWHPPTDRFQGQTTFQHDFPRYQNQPRQSFKPNEGAKFSDQPFDSNTSHRNDYVQHQIPPKFMRERETYKPTGAPLDALSTFKRDYKGTQGNRMQSFKPDNQAFSSEAPFEDGTTQRSDFRKWAMERPYVHVQEQYHKPEGEMEMNTSYKSNFTEMPLVRVQAQRPVSANRSGNVPFDGTTNYSQDFKKWQGERIFVPKQNDYVPNSAPFEGTSTYKGQFVPHAVVPTQSFRPDNQGFHSDSKFEGGTMYAQDYTPKEIQICEAALLDQGRSRYKFDKLDSRGHRLYAPVMTTITPLRTQSPNQTQQRLAMSMA